MIPRVLRSGKPHPSADLVTGRKHARVISGREAKAPIAQLDRASVYGTEGRGFESLWAHHSR